MQQELPAPSQQLREKTRSSETYSNCMSVITMLSELKQVRAAGMLGKFLVTTTIQTKETQVGAAACNHKAYNGAHLPKKFSIVCNRHISKQEISSPLMTSSFIRLAEQVTPSEEPAATTRMKTWKL